MRRVFDPMMEGYTMEGYRAKALQWVDEKRIPAEVMKKDRPLVEAAGLDITPNSGIL